VPKKQTALEMVTQARILCLRLLLHPAADMADKLQHPQVSVEAAVPAAAEVVLAVALRRALQ
jgi:hypothetical protein